MSQLSVSAEARWATVARAETSHFENRKEVNCILDFKMLKWPLEDLYFSFLFRFHFIFQSTTLTQHEFGNWFFS